MGQQYVKVDISVTEMLLIINKNPISTAKGFLPGEVFSTSGVLSGSEERRRDV